jgi:tetratricopeptide (TPR) repeat protein
MSIPNFRRAFTLVVLCLAVPAGAEQGKDPSALMTQGKLEADLGNYPAAAEAFASVAGDLGAPGALRWEASVRLGLARSAAGEFERSIEAFKEVLARYSANREAIRFLAGALATRVPGKIWPDFKPQLEELLRSAEVTSSEDLAMGMTGPRRLVLRWSDFEPRAAWRPAPPGPPGDSKENGHPEIAAYELDKLLGLNMVPPTVERILEGRKGSLQLWVNGCKVYKEVQNGMAQTPEWSHEISRMKLFDSLIGNADRNLTNTLVDPRRTLVIVDHTRSFGSDAPLKDPPLQFDRRLVEKLRALAEPDLRLRMRGMLDAKEIDAVLKRRDALLAHLEALVAARGESAVIF